MPTDTDRQGRSLHPHESISTPPSKELDTPATCTVLRVESEEGARRKWRSDALNLVRDEIVSLTQNASLTVSLYDGNIPVHFCGEMNDVPSTHDTYIDQLVSAFVQLQLVNAVVVTLSDGLEDSALTYTPPPFPLDAVHDVNVVYVSVTDVALVAVLEMEA